MPECSICRRSYDERFQVFIPPHPESFDRIECARHAARIWGVDPAAAVPVLLPTIAAVGAGALRRPAAATAPPLAPRRAVAALAALAIAPGQVALTAGVGLFAAGSAASVYLAALPAGKPDMAAAPERSDGRKVNMPPAAQPEAPAPVSVASSEATELSSDAANRPAHVALHPTALLAAAPRVHAILSSRDASTQLASRRITVQSLVPATPSPPPTPADSGPSSTSTSPKPSATGTDGQNTKKEPTPGTVKPATPPTATPPVVPEEPVAATSASVSGAATAVESRTLQGSNQSGKQKPPSSSPPPPPTPPPPPNPPPTSTPPPSSAPPPSSSPPPSSTPPVTTPQQQPSSGNIRPGNGNGDPNHVHTGPPGHSGNGNHP